MLDAVFAFKIASRLTAVQEFPRNPEAIEAVAEDLIDLSRDDCVTADESEARARWLITEIRQNWENWTGSRDLIRMYRSRWPLPRTIKAEDNEAKELGEKPKIECLICNDTGAFKPGGRESSDRYVWCECQAGITLHFDLPDWLNILNGEPAGSPIFAPDPVQEIAKNPIHPATERELQSVDECPACLEKRRHTHAEYSKHHVKQETPQ